MSTKELLTYIRGAVAAVEASVSLQSRRFATEGRNTITGTETLTTGYKAYNITDNAVLTLPAAADSTAGDYISLINIQSIVDGKTLTIEANGTDELAPGSVCIVRGSGQGTAPTIRTGAVSLSVGGSKKLVITGKTNGDGGAGTRIECYFANGKWAIDATVEGQGNQSALTTGTGFTT